MTRDKIYYKLLELSVKKSIGLSIKLNNTIFKKSRLIQVNLYETSITLLSFYIVIYYVSIKYRLKQSKH